MNLFRSEMEIMFQCHARQDFSRTWRQTPVVRLRSRIINQSRIFLGSNQVEEVQKMQKKLFSNRIKL